ncbi:MAG: hypothetical protein IPN34_16550 [Planctomycetes bacterium]|nr:hypothetical protein [Planctomycetota bacterium]
MGFGLVSLLPKSEALDGLGVWAADVATEAGHVVHAAPAASSPAWLMDTDGDGLHDNCERIFGTDLNLTDTDGDGCSDLYEFCAFGDPLDALTQPVTTHFVRPLAYQLDQHTLRFSFLVFEPSGQAQPVLDRWGLIYRERWEDASPYLPMVRYQRRIDQLGSAAPAGSAVFEVGYNTPRQLFTDADPNYLGWHLYFSANWGSSLLHSVFNLRQVRGLLVETLYVSAPGGGGGQVGASFATFRPFDPGAAQAAAWQRNRACVLYLSSAPYQQRETGLAWFPVRAASCEPMNFAFCAPDCSATAWSIENSQAVRVLDPFALAGL